MRLNLQEAIKAVLIRYDWPDTEENRKKALKLLGHRFKPLPGRATFSRANLRHPWPSPRRRRG